MKKTIKKTGSDTSHRHSYADCDRLRRRDYQTACSSWAAATAAASAAFKALGDYKDSAALASACDYSIATDAYLAELLSRPARFFAALGDYKESASLVTACDYAIAQNTYDAGEYAHAAGALHCPRRL